MTKLLVSFCNFVNKPNNVQGLSKLTGVKESELMTEG
jgi:hypothetical protein